MRFTSGFFVGLLTAVLVMSSITPNLVCRSGVIGGSMYVICR